MNNQPNGKCRRTRRFLQLVLAGALLGGGPAWGQLIRYDFIGSNAADWQRSAFPDSSMPLLNTTAPGSVLDDPGKTFWNRVVNPGMLVNGRFGPGSIYRFSGRLELGNGVFGEYLTGETNGSTSGLLVNFENHPEPNSDLFAVGSLSGGHPLVLAGLNFNGALSYDFTLTVESGYSAWVTGKLSDSARVIWDSSVAGPWMVVLDPPVPVFQAGMAMSDGASAANILELSWSGVAVPEPSAGLLVLLGLAALCKARPCGKGL